MKYERDTYMCEKRHIKETYTCHEKRRIPQTCLSFEANTHTIHDLWKRLIYIGKETYKRDLYKYEKRPIPWTSLSFEANTYMENEVWKRHIHLWKKTYTRDSQVHLRHVSLLRPTHTCYTRDSQVHLRHVSLLRPTHTCYLTYERDSYIYRKRDLRKRLT